MIKIAPSILSADFSRLGEEINTIKSADYLHFDVMDGIFVPNISIGIPVLQSVRKYTDMVLDVHLMITRPERYIDAFASAGAERQLKRPSDFQQFMGSLVEVKLYRAKNGAKEFVGELTGYDDGRVSVSIGGNEITFEKSEVASVRLRISM